MTRRKKPKVEDALTSETPESRKDPRIPTSPVAGSTGMPQGQRSREDEEVVQFASVLSTTQATIEAMLLALKEALPNFGATSLT